MAESLYILDGHAHCYRHYHASERQNLRSPNGEATGAVFGFIRMLESLIKNKDPRYIIAIFDSPGPTFRHEIFEDYKANRKPMPEDLRPQVERIIEILQARGIQVIRKSGFEADDIMATIASQASAHHIDSVLVTGDKDMQQIVTDKIQLYDIYKDSYSNYNAVVEKTGLEPRQFLDLLALWGDTADNIPGVPGIGEKKGRDLLLEHKTLDATLEWAKKELETLREKNAKKIPKMLLNLVEFTDQAYLSKKLATLDEAVDVEFNIADASINESDTKKLSELYRELGFTSLLKGLAQPEFEERKYTIVRDVFAFEAFLQDLANQTEFAFDTETTGLDPFNDCLVGLSFSWRECEGYYIALYSQIEPLELDTQTVLTRLRPILENQAVKKIGHNIKFDAHFLLNAGVHLRGIYFDTMIAAHLLSSDNRSLKLDDVSLQELGMQKIPTSEIIGKGKSQTTMDKVPVSIVGEYACEDADATWRLYKTLAPQLEAKSISKVMFDIEMPLLPVLLTMEHNGIAIDSELLEETSAWIATQLEGLTLEAHEIAGHSFNLNSPKQVGVVLFEEQDLPVIRKTKTGPSTDSDVLEKLAPMSRIAEIISEHRTLSKLKNTYFDVLPSLVNKKTNRIHTSFHQTRTATGRLSSSDPNLQNIPIRTELGRSIREAFIPCKDGYALLSADYSQIELRLIAHLAQDTSLIEAFKNGEDIHASVAAQLAGVDIKNVDDEMRSKAKAINFGIIYGQGPHALSEATNMTHAEAKGFIDSYFETYPRIKEFIEKTHADAKEAGKVRTILGHERLLPNVHSSYARQRAAADRMAVNTIIQGSAADLIKLAMLNMHSALKTSVPNARLLIQIHDELLYEAPVDDMPALEKAVRDGMENAMSLTVPLTVNIGVGENWLSLK